MNAGKSAPDTLIKGIRMTRGEDQKERPIDIPEGDPVMGEQLYNKLCASCHSVTVDGAHGPAMEDIYLSKIATRRTFRKYSAAFKEQKKFRWTRDKLYQFMWDSAKFIPGTLMEYEGPKDPYRISCVVEYLVTLKMQQNNKLGRELDEEY